jgi:hypothetical protein
VAGDVRSNSDLEFLSAIERGEVVTRMTLKKSIGVYIGLINALVKRGMRNGYVKAYKVPFKRYALCDDAKSNCTAGQSKRSGSLSIWYPTSCASIQTIEL